MNQVVIFVVPAGAAQGDFELALREAFGQLEISEATGRQADHTTITDNDQLPLWTWFIPNPCP